jgi:serine protease DegQ
MPADARSRPLTLVAVVIVAAVALAACAGEPGESGRAASPSAVGSPTASGSGALPSASTVPMARGTDIPAIVERVVPSVVSIIRSDGGQGSGVIWSEDGIVVTNHHVVDGAEEVQVGLADGERVDAEVIASDPRSDLAVVRADRDGLPAAEFREDLPDVGETAIAIGTPLGLENTVTAGIVSALHRAIPGAAQQAPGLVDLLQTDAAISPGNSGGALVDDEGRIMGVNVAYLPPNPPGQRGAVSIGFAIPAPTVRDVVEQLLEDGTVEHAYLGIQPSTLTPEVAAQLGTDRQSGVVVLDVVEGSPAAAAGLAPGDLLVALDGEPLDTAEDLLGALRRAEPGQAVSLDIVRDGEELTLDAELADLPQLGR